LPVSVEYMVGNERPATAISSIVDARPAESLLNVCSRCLIPPNIILKPMSKRTLITIEPTRDALTISTSPALMANTAIISSIALPNVAFSRPPTMVLVLTDKSWVDLAMRVVKGIIASIVTVPTSVGLNPARLRLIERGTKIRNT